MSAEQGVAPEAVAEAFHAFEQGSKVAPLTAASISNQSIQESMRLILMVRAYQVLRPILHVQSQHHCQMLCRTCNVCTVYKDACVLCSMHARWSMTLAS